MAASEKPTPRRLVDDVEAGASERWLAEHLRNVAPAPPPLSTSRVARIEEGVVRLRVRLWSWRWLAPVAVSAVVLAALQVRWHRIENGSSVARREGKPTERTIAEDARILVDNSRVRVMLAGAEAAVSAPPYDQHVTITDGRLLVKTREGELAVEAPDGKVKIRSRSKVEILVRNLHTRVATFSGGASVEWNHGANFEIAAGTAMSQKGVEVASGDEAKVADRILDRDIAGSPASVVVPAPSVAPFIEAAPSHVASSKIRSDKVEPAIRTEARLLSQAVVELRQKKNAKASLLILKSYLKQFPGGDMRAEADRLEIDALLEDRRRADALSALDGMKLDGERNLGFLVTRGELRGEAGRAADATRDFSSALKIASGNLAERALYGRAQAYSKLGNVEAAKRDLREVLFRFPEGVFAKSARAALSK